MGVFTHTVFLPLALLFTAFDARQGLAMAAPAYYQDRATLRVGWWYVWGWCGKLNCVPMVRGFESPRACPPQLLAGNEPNAIEPWGAPMPANVAALRVQAIAAQCPETELIVGNVSTDDWGQGSGADWVRAFLSAYPGYSGTVGVHCYSIDTADKCNIRLAELRSLYAGEMWVTEFNCLGCPPGEFGRLLRHVRANFSRWAVFTNRQTGNPSDLDGAAPVVDGALTENGQVYASAEPASPLVDVLRYNIPKETIR